MLGQLKESYNAFQEDMMAQGFLSNQNSEQQKLMDTCFKTTRDQVSSLDQSKNFFA